jgi:hypothetical protein
MMTATETPSTHLFAFEREVHRLIEQTNVGVTEFFDRNPGMRSAKWTIAHFSYGQGKSAEQGAADWFAECVKPAIERMALPTPDPFTLSYIEAALALSHDDEHESFDEFGVENLAPETLQAIVADCAKFQAENAADIAAMEAYRTRGEWTVNQLAGNDFWLTRNHHGAGFWDRGMDELGERLTAAAESYGETSLYLGDDGYLYLE